MNIENLSPNIKKERMCSFTGRGGCGVNNDSSSIIKMV